MEILSLVTLVCISSAVIPSANSNGDTYGFFSFKSTSVLVKEPSTVILDIQRRAGKNGTVYIGCEVLGANVRQDFSDHQTSVKFNENEISGRCEFEVNDDSIPEGNETFVVQLKKMHGGGELENPQNVSVTILANDRAYGVIGFSQKDPVTVQEPAPDSPVPVTNITLLRLIGLYGSVSVNWKFVSDSNKSVQNFEQTSGTVSFVDGQSVGLLSLQAKPDNIAENDQVYNLHLTSVHGGAELNSSYSDLRILIPANDAQVMFPITSLQLSVPENISIVELEVFRGLQQDGVTTVGNIQENATINWYVVPGNTEPGQDFQNKNGTITFGAGETKKSIQIKLINDKTPELAENFSVHLKTSVHNVYIGPQSVAMVTILPNDDQHGVFSFGNFSVLLDEDSQNTGDFFVNRSAGTFGNVSLSWKIVPKISGVKLFTVFEQISGIIVFGEGESLKPITIVVRQDSIPEETEEYYIELSKPTGGSRLGNTQAARRAVFYVIDSDSAYGIIEFADQKQQKIIQSTVPRQLSLEVNRIGGSLRTITVNYSIEYYLPGSSSPSNELGLIPSGPLIIGSGKTKETFSVSIVADSFIKFGSVFKVQLLGVQLVGDGPVVKAKSPSLGNQSTIYLNVTANDADGEIGFEKLHQTIKVHEPVGPSVRIVNLLVVRDGTAGRATVEWTIASNNINFNASDVGPRRGVITFEKGQNAVNLSIIINPDDIPEVDEAFNVTLGNVTSPNRLQVGMESATVTILQNDNPGGTFEFQNNSSVTLKEGDLFEVIVVRHGSALDARSVAFKMIPVDYSKDFFGSTSTFTFKPYEVKKSKFVHVENDSVPELDEHFTLELYPKGNEKPGTMGSNIAINITITANDDPYGVIEFAALDSVKRIDEMKGENTTVKFSVERALGTFGNVDVTWVVLSDTNGKLDVYPTSGVLKFLEKESSKNIEIQVLPDKIPEQNETFVIHLQSHTGQTSFGSRRNATLIINKNDDPVYFTEPMHVKVREGQTANLTIHRGGDGLSSITVTYSTIDGTAQASDGDFMPITLGHVTFEKGEFTQSISVVVSDDEKPEGVENFTVKLINSTGDSVIQNDVATVFIYASDAGTGLFEFTVSGLNKTIKEDGSASFKISRSIAKHGKVHVYWQVFRYLANGSLVPLPSGVDIVPSMNYVTFADGQSENSLVIKSLNDNVAEIDEKFVIRIINATGIETGENGRLGNLTSAYLTVLANDDPNGVLLFPSESRDIEIPEDFLPGFQNTTIKNMTVTRNQGDWGDIQVIWEITTANVGVKSPSTFDLLFLGSVEFGVTSDPRKRRQHTRTNVYCFSNSRSGSYGTVSSLKGLSSNEITISSWIQPANSFYGYLLSYDIGGVVKYALAVNTIESTSSIVFVFGDRNVTVNLGTNIADNSWHMIVVTIVFGRGEAKFYLDGQEKGITWNFRGGSVSSSGTFTVGGLRPDQPGYSGCVQDLRIHATVLEKSIITEMFQSISDFRQLNGYIDFPAGVRNREFQVNTVDNDKPEKEKTFSVTLLVPKGGATLDKSHAKAILKVLKSDNANGLFGFASSLPLTLSEQSNQSITITRKKGNAGGVTVTWGVYKGFRGLELATSDFQRSKGSILFTENESSKNIYISPRDDRLPELDEHFVLKLVSSKPGDGRQGSTPTSGASLDPNFTEINITITKNDFPFGLLQFMDRVPAWNDTILPAVDAYYKDVRESSGSVELIVVRAQGAEGTVKCSWKIEPQTAKPSIDYENDAGKLTFQPNVRSAKINIKLKDDNIPELNKTFKVVLYDPTGGANLSSVASSAVVQILPSDDAFGVMNFTRDSLSRTVNESASVRLTVLRSGGSLGPVTVYWEASGPHQVDLIPMEGSVDLLTGEKTAQINFRIADDALPELSESYLIQLVNVSSGRLAASGTVSNITIIASDNPYGVFEFKPSVVSVPEHNTNITLSIFRRFGVLGVVRVYYKTMSNGDMFNSVSQQASGGKDFVESSGYVEFSEGQSNASFMIQVLDDSIPEDEEIFLVNLTRIEIIKHSPVVPVPTNSPVIGRSRVAQVKILRNDNASGILQLSASSVNVTEPYSRPIVNVTRTAGDFGQVSVYFKVTPNTASTSDYRIIYHNVTFRSGQRNVAVPIEIVNDNQPEYDETFTIKLLSSGIQGGAVLGSPLECLVTIGTNDYPYGLIGFVSSSLKSTTEEPSSGSSKTVTLQVERRYGIEGTIEVHWEAVALNDEEPSKDVYPVSGSLVFPPGSSDKVQRINFKILPDDYPEINEVIQIHLLNVTRGKAVLNPQSRVSNITILANDEPHGVIHFTQKTYNVIEGNDEKTIAHLEVKRDYGTFGDVRLFYSTVPLSGLNSSIPNVDYTAKQNASIIIPNGNSSSNIPIAILNDSTPELDEMFKVILEGVELVGWSSALPPRLTDPSEANITILSNDDANGLFIVVASSPDPGTGGSRKTILEGNTSVSFIVKRLGGKIGTVEVEWTISSSSNVTKEADFTGDGAILRFLPGESQKQAVIQIKDDNIPETDEVLVISLTNPTNGAKVSSGPGNNLTVVISANDVVAGRVGFSMESRSVVTKEGSNVSLLVQRSSPAAGRVTIPWTVIGGNVSHDFVPFSGDLTFSQYQTEANITFHVKADAKPEPNEVFTVVLTGITTYEIAPSGEAVLISDQTSATVSVQASNDPHGVVEFQQDFLLYRTDEVDKNVTLVVTRLFGTLGSVRVYYQVKNASTADITADQQLATAGVDFTGSKSFIDIMDGQSVGKIPVHIIDENKPELAEVFIVNITGIELLSNPYNTSGKLPRLGQNIKARVVINSNDNPKGLLGFSQKRYYVNESTGAFNVFVERTQGTIGNISVNYFVDSGTAIRKTDFDIPAYYGGESTLTFHDGKQVQNITIYTIDNSKAEDNKRFTITLRKVDNELRYGYTTTEVVILHNDDARGVFSFETTKKTIFEPGNGPTTSATFKVIRKIASFGTVVVGWRVLNSSASMDIKPVNGTMEFKERISENTFTIQSLLDANPEKEEVFVIGLSIISDDGGRLESPYEAVLTIAENDYPYGELEITSIASSTSTVSVEESAKTLKAKVSRKKGSFGRITVDYQTVPNTAASSIGDVVHFETIQGLKTTGAQSWYSFSAYGVEFLILASNSSSDVNGYSGSTLYRWQGVFTKIQTIQTDGAVQWDSISISGSTYLAVANYGEEGRTETLSSVYQLDRNFHLTLVQNISTQGASDMKFFNSGGQFYLVVANGKNNAGATMLNLKVYKWQTGLFTVQSPDYQTRAASGLAVFTINGVLMLSISNFYDSVANSFSYNSPVYKWEGGKFVLNQEISTNGPIGVEYFTQDGEHFLVFANTKGDVTIHQWKANKFEKIQSIPTMGLRSAKAYIYGSKAHLSTVESISELKIYIWNSAATSFVLQMNTTVPGAYSVQPVVMADPFAGQIPMLVTAVSGFAVSPVLVPVKLSYQADFIPRKGQLTFEDGETELILDFSILQDTTPEKDETFSILLSNATGKAVIGSNKQLTVTILSNNNAHGRIGFRDDSLEKIQAELKQDTVVSFEILREYGQFGRVVVLWNTTGRFRPGDISPVSGALVFSDGEKRRNLSITVHKDDLPELDEEIKIKLVGLNETGSSDPGRGALINTARAIATLIIPGNDEPHGVIGWSNTVYLSQEAKSTNKNITVTIKRHGGLIGGVAVSYETVQPLRVFHGNEQVAVAGVDFIAKREQLVISDGVNSTHVTLDIIHANFSSLNKLFYVNITAVHLQQGSPTTPLVTNSPRVDTESRLLEVVISQINVTLGELNFNISQIQTTEGSNVMLMIVRSGGVDGDVGLHYTVRPSIHASMVSASSSDYHPADGTLYFKNGETSKVINITVNDDAIPEVDEGFYVLLERPINGVRIGSKNRVDVVIKANDDPYGVFGFKVSSVSPNTVKEGKTLRLEVQRLGGSFGQVHVTWSLNKAATSQISPFNGTLTFEEGTRTKYIVLLAVNDSIPEAVQQYTCALETVDNDARINASHKTAVIEIPANDKANGYISIDPSTSMLLVGEPDPTSGYDGVFTIRILRTVGQIGKAVVSWQIKLDVNSTTGSRPDETFNVSSGHLTFTDGVKIKTVAIQVKPDTNPEEFTSYVFIITPSGADLASPHKSIINVAASDYPYGVFSFKGPNVYNVSEDIRYVNLTVYRRDGNIGHVDVNFTVTSSRAIAGVDYEVSTYLISFANKIDKKQISIKIKNDNIPELAETLLVRLDHVNLRPTRPMNYSSVGGLRPDQPPRIGNESAVNITILKNDDANGIIQLMESSKNVHERDKQVVIGLNRSGGALGKVVVHFIVRNGTATFGEDYNQSSGSVEFNESQTTANLTISILDDSKPEHLETFSVELQSVTGGAVLGSQRSITINILTSDNPYGLVGFVNTTDFQLPNPNVTRTLTFGVSRSDGTQGVVSVKWRVIRVKPSSGDPTEDFIGDIEGDINFSDGDGTTTFIDLKLDPYKGPEPQETFVLQLSDITGGATLDSLRSNITLTVLKHGFPNGIFSFKVTSVRIIDEPDIQRALSLTVERSVGDQGEVKDKPEQDSFLVNKESNVYWRAVGADPQDLESTSGVVTFPAKENLANVVVTVKGDDVPELNKTFIIMLYKVDGGGDLDLNNQNITITIRANDDPHGVFNLKPGAQNLVVTSSSRRLNFTIQRDRGAYGDVTVNYHVTHSSWYPSNLDGSVTVHNGEHEFRQLVTLSSSTFLEVGSSFQITLIGLRYASSGGPALSSSPKLSSTDLQQTINVPETAANGLFRFAQSSTRLTAQADNTVSSIMVIRQGLYGSVSVTWNIGYPEGSAPEGYTSGQIEPKTGTLLFNPSTRNKTFSVKAIPIKSPTNKLAYAIHLQSATTPSDLPGGANITSGSDRTAIVDYSGVVEIAPDSRTKVVTEGGKVTCRLVRLYSVFGSIVVHYVSQGRTGTVNMADGEYEKEFTITSRDNNIPEQDYRFFINITQVTGSESPRLGANTASMVTVKDNDNANGIFSFKTTAIRVTENATSGNTRVVQLTIQRTGGTFGAVSVVVRTVGGGEPWDEFASPTELKDELAKRAKDANATVENDYVKVEENLSFENAFPFPVGGQSKSIQLTIHDDSIAEPDEKVYLYLTNATGGARLATTSDNLQSWAVVTIEGNDMMNGEIGFISGSQSATIDEDGSAKATLKLERRGARFGTVTVVWRVREPEKRSQVIEDQGSVVFAPDVRERDFVISMRKDAIPEFKDTFHVDLVELQNSPQARIIPSASTAVITVLDSDYPYGMFGFAPQSLYKPVNLKTTEVSLDIVRSYGNTTDVTVTYETQMIPEKSTESGVTTSQAVVGQDYQKPAVEKIGFRPGVTKRTITVTLTPKTPSHKYYPKAFGIKIINATNKAVINSQTSRAMVIISNDEDTTRFLALRAASKLSPLSDQDINKILADLKIYVKKPLDNNRLLLTKDTIQNVLNDKKNRPLMLQRKLQDISKTTLMDIFDELLNPSRSDTRDKAELPPVFEMFAFSLAYGTSCPTTASLGLKGKYAYATAYRKPPSMLNGLQVKSVIGKHYFSYPSNLYIGVDSSQSAQCNDVHFIDYYTSHWFKGAVLNDKVLSTSLNDTSTLSKSKNLNTYVIFTGNKRVTPKGAKCVYWDFSESKWSTKGCSVKRDKEDFVECQCNHMSNFAAQGESDDRVGYSTYFFAACFVCMGAFALALLSHHACSVDNLFSAKLLMHMFFSCMGAQLMYVVGAYVSSSQAVITEEPVVRCSVLGMFIHYFFLCQFSWMFIQGWNLWRILVLNDEHTDRKYVLFFVLGWGMPVVIIVLYIIVAQAAFSWNLHQMYGDVHKNGDMCFIPNAYAALASVVAPTLLFLMGVAVVFTQAYQVTMQWRYYDDIYRGHYNIKEVRNVIILFIAVVVTWLFAGLHLAYGYLWMIILFVILDVMLGLYVFILFFILRNQVRGVFKQTYAFRGEPPPIQTHDDFFRGQMGTEHSTGSSKPFKMRQSPEMPIHISTETRGDEPILLKKTKLVSEWDDLDNIATPTSNRKLMVNMDDNGSIGRMNETFEDDMETQDFDDLIFALKTGGNFDTGLDDEKEVKLGQGAEQFELRRISIPDTHL